MFRRDHIKTKLTAFVLLNLALCLVFLVLIPEKTGGGSIQIDFYGIEQMLVYYPLLAVLYGIATAVTSFRDYVYAGLMGVIFFVCALANSLRYDIVEPPAAFVYTGIMLAFMLAAFGVIALVRKWRGERE